MVNPCDRYLRKKYSNNHIFRVYSIVTAEVLSDAPNVDRNSDIVLWWNYSLQKRHDMITKEATEGTTHDIFPCFYSFLSFCLSQPVLLMKGQPVAEDSSPELCKVAPLIRPQRSSPRSQKNSTFTIFSFSSSSNIPIPKNWTFSPVGAWPLKGPSM